jgi:muconolactone D-isomerase
MNMQEYLVQITIGLPAEMVDERRADLTAAELERGRELLDQGTIARIWRLPGRQANVGIWMSNSATELHARISSLPLYPWMTVEVTPLAVHPIESEES